MGSFTDFAENGILNYQFGLTSYVPSGVLYVGLSTSAINDDGTGLTEVTGTNYARVAIDNNKTTWSVSTTGGLQNDIVITFPQAGSNWGTITHAFIADQATTGNMIVHGALTTSKTIETDDTAQFSIGNVIITLD